MHPRLFTRHTQGYFVLFILVFGAVFLLMFTSLTGLIVTQKRHSTHVVNNEQALQIAEAGLDYYRWYLAHYPNDTTNGTTTPQPYVHGYADPEGGALGSFALSVSSNLVCGETTAVDITSVGYTAAEPEVTRTVYARYARPTVSEYAYIINSNVWAGEDRTIIGPYHANGGIHMDGTNNSTVSSGVEDWLCTSSYGCSPSATKDGVFGDGPNSDLWQFPTPPVNFVGLTVDLATMKARAQDAGLYFGPSGWNGYHVVFQGDGTFRLYTVRRTYNFLGQSPDEGWAYEDNVIRGEAYAGTYTIPNGCGMLFFEDRVWVEGVVEGKVSIAAANVSTAGVDHSLILSDDITYTTDDGSDGLLAIAEEDVLIPLDSPDDMELNGIFVAQHGRFGRNHYSAGYVSPSWLDPYVRRNSLTINGTIVSNGRVGTKWVTSSGTFVSGYETRYNSYDRNLVDDPPPLTPYVSEDYTFIEWREVEE